MRTDTPANLLAALNVEKAQINTYKAQLGFSTGEIDENSQDHANLAAALSNVEIERESGTAVTRIKDRVYNGDPDDDVEAYPSFALTALPFPDVKAGALSRYNNRKGRAKLASAVN